MKKLFLRDYLPKFSRDLYCYLWILRASYMALSQFSCKKIKIKPLKSFQIFQVAEPLFWLRQKWKLLNNDAQYYLEELHFFYDFQKNLREVCSDERDKSQPLSL